MYHETRTPATELRTNVNRYCIIKYNNGTTIREINPSTNIWVYFNITNQSSYKLIEVSNKIEMPKTITDFIEMSKRDTISMGNTIMGPHRTMGIEVTQGETTIIGIEFKTGINKSFFGHSIEKIANTIIPVDESFVFLQKLRNVICGTPRNEVFNIIDNFLIDNMSINPYSIITDNKLYKILENIEENPFNKTADNMANLYSTSLRNFNRIMKSYVGLSPQQFIMTQKIKKLTQIMIDSPQESIITIVSKCGYEDLTHLNRDFRLLGGSSASKVIDNIRQRLEFIPSPLAINDLGEGVLGINLF